MGNKTRVRGKRASFKASTKAASPKSKLPLAHLKKSHSVGEIATIDSLGERQFVDVIDFAKGTVGAKTKTRKFVSVAKARTFKAVDPIIERAWSPVDVPTVERSIRQALARKAATSNPDTETALAAKLVTEVEKTSPDVNVLCESYGLRREELSRLTGFSLRALADWSAGKLPSQPAQRRLQEIRRLLDALAEIVKTTSIPGWMRKPNPAFDNLAPLQVIELGEIDRLWAMVHQRA